MRVCYRDIQSRGFLTLVEFWLGIICDVIMTAPLERWEALGKDHATMKNLKTNLIGLLACLAVIVIAFLLLVMDESMKSRQFCCLAMRWTP